MTTRPGPYLYLCAGCSAALSEHSSASHFLALPLPTLLRLAQLVSPSRGRLSALDRREAGDLEAMLLDVYREANE